MEEEKKDIDQSQEPPIVHNFEKSQNIFTLKFFLILTVILILGIGTGYVLSSKGVEVGNISTGNLTDSSKISKGTKLGSDDLKTFKDTAEGILKEGGIEGEGAFHLVRPGGDSQNVYMTSSTVDLSKLIDKKIKVWGQTQKAQYAGWLMDVGRVEVIQ
ncbi:MAG: hypothetical protein HYT08_01935 [Candidatus Levybacteria bacterium]|nr:hypothetical protein [Candidatus Levybacteria bacterium]